MVRAKPVCVAAAQIIEVRVCIIAALADFGTTGYVWHPTKATRPSLSGFDHVRKPENI
jgi:hypothetical protein